MSFKASGDDAIAPAEHARELVSAVLSESELLSLSKGRYEPHIASFMKALGVDVESSKSVLTGTISADEKKFRFRIRFKFMRDAEIPGYVSRHPLHAGFAGSHQVYDARAIGALSRAYDVPVIAHPSARFVIAAHKNKIGSLVGKLERGRPVTLTTEYFPSAHRVAVENGWSVNFYHSAKGMAEIDASENPDWFDGVVAIADTEKTLRANDLSVIDELDHLAPLAIHFVWRPDRATDGGADEHTPLRESLAAPLEDMARPALLNPWLDGRHAERIQEMLAERKDRSDE